jgi:D-alanine-D-alanine ligase
MEDTRLAQNKIRIGILFGGRSGEHEVSLMSARSVLDVLDPQKYEVIQIGITQEGNWVAGDDVHAALQLNGETSLI